MSRSNGLLLEGLPMSAGTTRAYRVLVTKDPETGSVVAEVPTLQIADFGADVPEALDRLRAMLSFHLECLREEGKPVPFEETEDEGFYLRVKFPVHAT
jgi:predicted RNase H-like HicB family nuclease